MLFEFLNHSQVLDLAELTETLNTAKLRIKPTQQAEDFVLKLFDELKTISQRDTFELFVEASGENLVIRGYDTAALSQLKSHLSNHQGEDDFEIELIIDKSLDNAVISIYYLDAFAKYLKEEKLFNLISTFSKLFTEKLFFEVFCNTPSFGSSTIYFFEYGSKPIQSAVDSKFTRHDKLMLFRENAITTNIPLKLLPSDFNLIIKSNNTEINRFFYRIGTILSIIFIANTSELNQNNQFSFKVCGYKAITCGALDLDLYHQKFDLLVKIFSWAYEGGNNSDKLGLVRNVFSIHLDSSGNILVDEEVWSAIQSNYQIYLKGNIQSYLEVKNKIGELILESSSRAYSMVDELLDSLKNNVFIILSFILTVVVVNGLKDSGESVVFSDSYLLIVILLSVVSAFWLLMTKSEVLQRYENAASNLSDILKANYEKILMAEEIENLVNPIISKNREHLHAQARKYSWWWFGMLVIIVLGFVLGNHFFAKKDLPNQSNSIVSGSPQNSKASHETKITPSTPSKLNNPKK